MSVMPDLVEALKLGLSVFGGGIAAYVGIRSDLARIAAQLKHVEDSLETAHRRIDTVLMHRAGK